MPFFKISRAEGVAETDPVKIAVAAAVEYSVAPFVEVVEAVEAAEAVEAVLELLHRAVEPELVLELEPQVEVEVVEPELEVVVEPLLEPQLAAVLEVVVVVVLEQAELAGQPVQGRPLEQQQPRAGLGEAGPPQAALEVVVPVGQVPEQDLQVGPRLDHALEGHILPADVVLALEKIIRK